MKLYHIVAPDGCVLDSYFSREEADHFLKRGVYCDGYDGIGRIWVNIPPGSRVE